MNNIPYHDLERILKYYDSELGIFPSLYELRQRGIRVSTAAYWGVRNRLKKSGYVFQSEPRKGHAPHRIERRELESRLASERKISEAPDIPNRDVRPKPSLEQIAQIAIDEFRRAWRDLQLIYTEPEYRQWLQRDVPGSYSRPDSPNSSESVATPAPVA